MQLGWLRQEAGLADVAQDLRAQLQHRAWAALGVGAGCKPEIVQVVMQPDASAAPVPGQLPGDLGEHPAGGAQAEWQHSEDVGLAPPPEAQILPSAGVHIHMVVCCLQVHRKHPVALLEDVAGCGDRLVLERGRWAQVPVQLRQIQHQPILAAPGDDCQRADHNGGRVCDGDGALLEQPGDGAVDEGCVLLAAAVVAALVGLGGAVAAPQQRHACHDPGQHQRGHGDPLPECLALAQAVAGPLRLAAAAAVARCVALVRLPLSWQTLLCTTEHQSITGSAPAQSPAPTTSGA